MWLSISFFMIFGACQEDPILQTAEQLQKNPPKSEGISKKPSFSTKKKDPPKVKVFAPGKPNEPKPVKAKDPNPVKPNMDPPKPKQQEEQIQIKGKIIIENWSGKIIRIDIFDGDQRKIGGKRPSVVATRRIKDPNNFSISIPKTSKSLWIGAYVDENEDGRPGGKDPSGWYRKNPIAGDQNHQNITLSLTLPKEQQP